MFDRADLEKLKTIYWEIEPRGKHWEAHAEALSRIYYAIESVLNKPSCEGPVADAIQSEAILVETDTVLDGHKQRRRIHPRVSETL